jgi:amino acid transporter
MADAASRAWPGSFLLLMVIALFATTNTVLGFLMSSSRLAYGLAEEGVAWGGLARVDKWRRTPYVAVALSGALAILLIFLTDYLPGVTGWRLSFGGQEYQVIDLVGKTASLAVLLAFLLVNSSVVALRRRKGLKRHFRVPLNIGDFPLLPVLANVLIVFFVALSFGDWIVWLSTIIVALLGLVMYKPSRN